jgi:hypothetical protein
MFPALETIQIAPWRGAHAATSHAAKIAELPAAFPRLRRIIVDLQGLRAYEPGVRPALEAVATLPLVEWLDPKQLPIWPSWTVEQTAVR